MSKFMTRFLKDESGATAIEYRPVHLYTLDDDVEMVPPKARVY